MGAIKKVHGMEETQKGAWKCWTQLCMWGQPCIREQRVMLSPLPGPHCVPSTTPLKYLVVQLGTLALMGCPSATFSQTYSSFHENKHPDFCPTSQLSMDWYLPCLGQVSTTQVPPEADRLYCLLGWLQRGGKLPWRWHGNFLGSIGTPNTNQYLCSLTVWGVLLWLNKHFNEIRRPVSTKVRFHPHFLSSGAVLTSPFHLLLS